MKEKNNSTFATELNENSVSLEEFIGATAQWKYVNDSNGGMIGDVILANYFDIPMDDFAQVVNEISKLSAEDAVSARAYIGIERIESPTVQYEMKLYFTGVNSNNQPILANSGGSAIFDFTLPCPPTC